MEQQLAQNTLGPHHCRRKALRKRWTRGTRWEASLAARSFCLECTLPWLTKSLMRQNPKWSSKVGNSPLGPQSNSI